MSFVVVAAGAAHAQDVIAIKKGTFVVDDGRNNSITIAGTRGFGFDGSINLASAGYDIIELCWLPECAPGTVLDLSDSWGGSDVFGIVRFRGKTPPDTIGELGRFLAISASVRLPPISDGPVTVSVPFDFSGFFEFGLDEPRPSGMAALGGGTATLTLVPLAEDPRFWHIQQIVFDFTPVNRR